MGGCTECVLIFKDLIPVVGEWDCYTVGCSDVSIFLSFFFLQLDVSQVTIDGLTESLECRFQPNIVQCLVVLRKCLLLIFIVQNIATNWMY